METQRHSVRPHRPSIVVSPEECENFLISPEISPIQNNNQNNNNNKNDQKQQQQQQHLRQVTFDDRNHLSVMCQMHGSVWPKVLPYAIANALLTGLIYFLKNNSRWGWGWIDFHFDMTFPKLGHKFMSIMVAFLTVSRANTTYKRFMQARRLLSDTYRTCRELVQHMCCLSRDDTTEGAVRWRRNVAYRTILMLKVTMGALEFPSSNVDPLAKLKLPPDEIRDIYNCLDMGRQSDLVSSRRRLLLMQEHENTTATATATANVNTSAAAAAAAAAVPVVERGATKWAIGARNLEDDIFRAPILMAYNLRREIMVQRQGGYLENRFRHVNEELKMMDFVTDFMKAFHKLQILVTTPFPFPLVQMGRTFLFFWIFTLPFAIVHSITEHPWEPMFIMLLTTYGFLGLEYVSMELDDPFGDDANDFDVKGLTNLAYEDIYITIYKIDGAQSATRLRKSNIYHNLTPKNPKPKEAAEAEASATPTPTATATATSATAVL